MAIGRTMAQLFLIISLQMVILVQADYHIGWSINSYSSPSNTLSNGTCCDGSCDPGTCRTTLRLCFRSAGHPHSDTESSCVLVRNRFNANFVSISATSATLISQYFPGEFQIYVRASHRLSDNILDADFDPPFTDPLIDDIFIEANVSAVSFSSLTVDSEVYTVTGDFGVATLTMAIHVRCAENYFGSACEMLCESDGTNCTTVLTAPPPTTTQQPSQPSTEPVVEGNSVDAVGIGVGVSLALLVLIVLGVGNVIFIIYCYKRGRKGSWQPTRRNPSLSIETVERDLTSNKINRISFVSDDGEEVTYTIVNKTKTPQPELPPPYKLELDLEDEMGPDSENHEETTAAESAHNPFAGYEPINFQTDTATEESSETLKEDRETEATPAKPIPKAKGIDGSGYETVDFGSPSSKPKEEAIYTNLQIETRGNGISHYQMPRVDSN